MNTIDKEFVEKVEKAHFRTKADTGANHNALLVWNCVRRHVGLPEFTMEDFPEWCMTHSCYHKIRKDYRCRPIESKEDAEKAFGNGGAMSVTPSKAEANKVIRVLEGKTLKYTVRIYRENGNGPCLEFQSDHTPQLKFDSELRVVMLIGKCNAYDPSTEYPMLEWHPGDVLTCEQNPEVKP